MIKNFINILYNNNLYPTLKLAKLANINRNRYSGNQLKLFTPIYISNHCENNCLYCGFRKGLNFQREKLSIKEIEEKMEKISATGIDDILILTGESYNYSNIEYINEAIKIAKKYFSFIGIEVYPLEQNDYEKLISSGLSYLTIYQETFDKNVYDFVHPDGPKKDFQYRYETPFRAINGGIKYVTIGVLWGLSEINFEIENLINYINKIKKLYPYVNLSLGFPRIKNSYDKSIKIIEINDELFLRIIYLFKIFFPDIGITISTRETENVRNILIKNCATKISVNSLTRVSEDSNYEQFVISDNRKLIEINDFLVKNNIEPLYTYW